MATHDDATLRIPTRFALGFMKSMDNRKRALGARLLATIATASSWAAPPSAMSAPAVRSVSPIPLQACLSATP